jgi:aspartate/methionine/tyrosine aminotransferase
MTVTRTGATFVSPIVESRRWVQDVTFPADRPLINVSQAAPIDPPPLPLRQAMSDAALHQDAAHLYGPVLGNPHLRAALAGQMSAHYTAPIRADQVAITSGCNQAFAAAIAGLCGEGDEVIIPTPWYFNHKMWLDLSGTKAVPLTTDPQMRPRVEDAVALILDETYRDFDSRAGAPHDLLGDADWDKTLIHLYSFSKAYRLTGHRVGALATSPERLYEVEKFLDTVTICPNQLGQIAALWGIENLQDWVAGERAEILDRRAAIAEFFPQLEAKGWKLLGLGAYFAYVEHPYDMGSLELAKRLVQDASVLMLPGTMFTPEGDSAGERQFRIAFANIDRSGLAELFDRLANLTI